MQGGAGHPSSPDTTRRPLDAWTIAAVTVVAWSISAMLHEGLGHGGTCLLAGAKPLALTSAYFDFDEATASGVDLRWIAAGGTIVNVLVGLPLLLLLPRLRVSSTWRFFLWLAGAQNLLTGFGYLLFSAVGGVGDWAAVIAGLPHAMIWRIAMGIAGAVLYFYVAPRLLLPGLAPFAGEAADRHARARRLTLLPYLVGGATSVAAGAFNPLGIELVLMSSVAAAFGGASLLAWFYPAYARRTASGRPPSLAIPRSRGWMAAAAAALAIFVGVFGRGLRF